MGEVGDGPGLVDGSIHVSGDDRIVEGIKEDFVFLGVLRVHEVSLCSTVKKDWSIDDFVVYCGFTFDWEGDNESHSIV